MTHIAFLVWENKTYTNKMFREFHMTVHFRTIHLWYPRKRPHFCRPPSLPPFSICPNGSKLSETFHTLTSKLRLPTTLPSPRSPLVSLQKNRMLKRKPKCCLKHSFLQTKTPVSLEHLQKKQTPVWNTYNRTRHQSETLLAEQDTSLEHL